MALSLKILAATAVLLAGSLVLVECYSYYINVNETSGENSIQCLQNDSISCSTLEWVLNQPTARRSSTKIQLTQGTHYLTKPFPPFQDLNSLAISGSQSVIECKKISTGFSFMNVYNMELHNLTILNCKMIINTTTPMFVPPVDNRMEFYKCYATLYFNLCANVTLDEIEITGNFGAAGLVFHNTIGQNVITHSHFSGSEDANVSSLYSGLGGVYIEFTYCLPSVQYCSNTKMNDSMIFFNSHANFSFRHVRFNNNKANIIPGIGTNPGMFPHRTMHNSFGKGGGLALIFKGNSSHNLIKIENCLFLHNKALWGSGLIVEFQDSSYLNTVNIVNTEFHNNGIKDVKEYPTVGGAIRIDHNVLSPPNPYNNMSTNNFILKDCSITNNTATVGGGMSVLQTNMDAHYNVNLQCLLTESFFTNNKAHLGSAVEASFFSNRINSHVIPILVDSSNFTANIVLDMTDQQIVKEGEGCIYTNGFPLLFQGENKLAENKGSALILSGTVADLTYSKTLFLKNSGIHGGAIQILNSAYILVGNNTSIQFVKNQARLHGGAIANMVEEIDTLNIYYNCFVRYHDDLLSPNNWSARFFFESNNAKQLGSSIFTTSLKSCSWAGIFNYSEVFCWKQWIYFRNNNPSDCLLEINTRAANISIDADPYGLNTFPGKVTPLSLIVMDELQRNVSSDTVLVVREEGKSALDVESYYNEGFVNVKLNDQENATSKITLGSSDKTWHIELKFHTKSCPPGLELQPKQEDSFACICMPLKGIECSSSTFEVSLKNGYWLGSPDDSNRWSTSVCPKKFCRLNSTGFFTKISQDKEQLNNQVCKQNRRGVVCSLCKNGFGISVVSSDLDCVHCNNTLVAYYIMKYLASEYIPLLIFSLCLLILGTYLTSGPTNSFIVYAQMISIILDPIIEHSAYHYTSANLNVFALIKFIYGVFNLNFVGHLLHPICLSTKLKTLDVLQLNYLIALFPLLVFVASIAFVSSCKYCKCFNCNWCKNINRSFVHAFSAYLLLSYTKFVWTSLSIVKVAHLFGHNYQSRVFYAGYYKSNDYYYTWKYKNPAWTILVVSIIFSIILCHYPLILMEKVVKRIKCIAKWYPSTKIKIFMDTFQGCYKDNRRYFAGTYFLFRLLMGATYTTSHDWFHQYIILLYISIVLIFLVALLRPYRKEYWFLNYVDLFVFTNLALVTLLSLYILSHNTFEIYYSARKRTLYIIIFLVFLPLIWMLTYTLWNLKFKKIQKLRKQIFKWILKLKMIVRKKISNTNDDSYVENVASLENSLNAILEQVDTRTSYQSISGIYQSETFPTKGNPTKANKI